MCSRDRAEVEAVKNELLKAGIVAEARNNPVAEALDISGVELWVHNERDFYNASRLYAEMQNHTSWKRRFAAGQAPAKAPEPGNGANKSEARPVETGGREVNPVCSRPDGELRGRDLDLASSVLEQEIDRMLDREAHLMAQGEALRAELKELGQTLAQEEAAFTRESERRAAAEKELTEKVSGLQRALERERADRAQAEEQFGRERHGWQHQLKSREDAMKEAQKKLDAQSQLLQVQLAEMAGLRETIADLERQRDADEKALSSARAEAAMEQELRLAAEERAEAAIVAHTALERRLHEQEALEQRMQVHVASMNSLCNKLQARRAGTA